MNYLNTIVNGDCVEIIPQLLDNSIDLVITSPPYNVDLGNNKYKKEGYDLYNDNKEHKDYIEWLRRIFVDLLYSKLKSGARIAINIGDGKNGAVPTHSDIIQMMKEKYLPISTIIWEKGNTSNRAAWGSYMSPSCPSFPRGFEYILIFAKDSKKLVSEGETDITKEEFIEFASGQWTIRGENRDFGHPAVFPEKLVYGLMKILSWKYATVLDMFCGSGTVPAVAKQLSRSYIGIDISKDYCDIAENRINEVQ